MESINQLIELLKTQDEAALQMLYEQYGKKFYSYCIRRWQLSQDDAWDVVYKTLETLVVKAGAYTFKSEKEFEGFIFKVLINFLKQWYRTNQSKNSVDVVLIDFTEDESQGSTVRKALNSSSIKDFLRENDPVESLNLKALKEALEKMDPTDADLLLFRAQNYSYEQIAAMLKIENAQLKVKHHRAKQKLIDLLNDK